MSDDTTTPAQEPKAPLPPQQKINLPNAPGDDLAAPKDLPIAMSERGLVLKTNRDAWRVANAMLAGRMVPKSYTTPSQVYTAILAGAELGLSPGASVRSIAVINGTPSLWGTGGYAIAMMSKHYDRHEITWQLPGEDETDIEPEFDVPDRNKDGDYDVEPLTLIPNGFRCICRAYRKDVVKPFVAKFSVADAKRAGLWGRTSKTGEAMPWSNYPARMLMHKAVGNALEAAFPGAYLGLTSASEAELETTEPPPSEQTINYPDEPTTLRRTDTNVMDATFTVSAPPPQQQPPTAEAPKEPEKVRKRRTKTEETKEPAPADSSVGSPAQQPETTPVATTTESVKEEPKKEVPKPVEEKKPEPEPVKIDPKQPPAAPPNGLSQSGQGFLNNMIDSKSKSDLGDIFSLLVRRLNSTKNDDAKAEAQFLVENCIRRRLEISATMHDVTTVAGWVNEVKARLPAERVEVLRDLLKVLTPK